MANVHLIIGEDDYLVAETAKKIIGDGVGLEVIDSLNSTNVDLQLADLREVDASFSTPPFLDPQKITWWKNVHFLPHQGGKVLAEEVKVALEKFAAKVAKLQVADNQHLLITGPKLMKASVFAKTLASVAEMAVFTVGKPWEAARNAAIRVIDLAADMNLKFDRGAAEHFISRVGVDSRSLASELCKMRDYLGTQSHTITMADIDDVASQGIGVEPEVWAITDSLGERNLEKVLNAARRFEQENGFAVLVTTVVEKFFRQLLDFKNGLAGELNPFVQRKMSGFLRNWTQTELRVARWRFLMLREKIVSGLVSGDVLVINELVRVCRREGGLHGS